MQATTTDVVMTEEQRVEDWRIAQFARLGFNSEQITIMVVCNSDHHEAANLLSKGCSFDFAVELLT